MNQLTIFFILLPLSFLVLYLLMKLLHLPMVLYKMIVVISLMAVLFTGLLMFTGTLGNFQFLSDIVDKVKEFVAYVAKRINN